MSIDHDGALVAWLPAAGVDAPRYVRRGALLVPAGVDTEPAAEPAEPGAELQVAEPVVEAELVDQLDQEQPGGDQEQPGGDRLDEGLVAARRGRRVWLPRRAEADRAVVSAEVLAQRLDADRQVIEVGRDDELARRSAAAEHQMALDDVAEQAAVVRRARERRSREAAEAEKLAELHRHTASAGERARIAAEIGRTAEMRALRVATTQKVALVTGLVLLVGFGVWSTAGVHDGLVRLLHLAPGSAGWWAGWIVEPLLITIVAGLILLRAVLRASGGDVDARARRAEVVALGGSLALNLFGGWEAGAGGWTVSLGQALAHSVGAIGAAGTAWLMGVVIDYTTSARPWDGAPRVADLHLQPSGQPAGRTPETAIRRGKRAPLPVDRGALPEDLRKLLDEVRAAITAGTLPVDPSAYAIYKRVMGGSGDRARSTEIAALVRGWRPLRSVDGGVRDVAS